MFMICGGYGWYLGIADVSNSKKIAVRTLVNENCKDCIDALSASV